MSDATCRCGLEVLTGEQVHPRLGIGRVEQAYCFKCNTLLYWQDGVPMAQQMAPVVTREAVAATPFFKQLQKLVAAGDDGVSIDDLTLNEGEVIFGMTRAGLASWEEVGTARSDDPLESPEPTHAVYATGQGRTILGFLQQAGSGYAAAAKLALLFARWRVNRKDDWDSLRDDSDQVKKVAAGVLSAAYAKTGEQPPEAGDAVARWLADLAQRAFANIPECGICPVLDCSSDRSATQCRDAIMAAAYAATGTEPPEDTRFALPQSPAHSTESWLAAALADNCTGPNGQRMNADEWIEWARMNAEFEADATGPEPPEDTRLLDALAEGGLRVTLIEVPTGGGRRVLHMAMPWPDCAALDHDATGTPREIARALLAAPAQASALKPGQVREPVEWFAGRMEAKLREHDAERGRVGWRDMSLEDLTYRLMDEYKELVQACVRGEDIIGEAADVGNIAMMIADNTRALLAATATEEANDEQA